MWFGRNEEELGEKWVDKGGEEFDEGGHSVEFWGEGEEFGVNEEGLGEEWVVRDREEFDEGGRSVEFWGEGEEFGEKGRSLE